jgi:hypothetical protein
LATTPVVTVSDPVADALALTAAWHVPLWHDAGPQVVTIADNYDRLRYSPDASTRDRRYTRYVGDGQMLHSHARARIPALLRATAVTSSTGITWASRIR